MASKRKAFIHVGMPGVADVLGPAIAHHRDALVELGVQAPAKHAQESFRAAVEVTRSHKTYGIRRKHVEGTWAGIYRRAQRGRDTVVFSAPLLAVAEPDQIDLFVDGLAGFEVHVVIAASAPHAWTVLGEPDSDLGAVLDRWERAVRRPERVHVILAESAPDRRECVERELWRRFGDVVGFGTASLGLADVPRPVAARAPWQVPTAPVARAGVLNALARSWVDHLASKPYDVVGDPHTAFATRTAGSSVREAELDRMVEEAMREVERLTHRNEVLADQLAAAARPRREPRPSATARRPRARSGSSPLRAGRRRQVA